MQAPTLFVVSEDAIVDTTTNKLTVINVFEDIATQGFPVLIPRIAVTSMFEKPSDAEGQPFEAVLSASLNGKVMMSKKLVCDYKGRRRCRVVVRVMQVVLPEPGYLRLTLKHEEDQLAEWTVNIMKTGDIEATVEQLPDVEQAPSEV